MDITFTVSPDQAKKMIDYYQELTEGKFVHVDGNTNGLAITKELMGDALTDEEREMFDSIPF